MTLTFHIVRYWWNQLNIAVFDGILDKPARIDLFDHTTEHAWTRSARVGRRVTISMHPTLISRKLMLTILVHEMVHAWEYLENGAMGHGDEFHSWAQRILKATTLSLTEEINENDFRRESEPLRRD